jgi:hypothetical protein
MSHRAVFDQVKGALLTACPLHFLNFLNAIKLVGAACCKPDKRWPALFDFA